MLSLLLLVGILPCYAEDPARQLEYIRLSYKANKDAFLFGTFRFEYTIGVSASASDAKSGIFTRSIKEDGFYAFDGKNARYELTADPKAVAAVSRWIDSRRTSSLARTFRLLTDGKVTFMDLLYMDPGDTVLRHNPQIVSGTHPYDDRFDFPLYVGSQHSRPYDLFRDLTAIKDDKASLNELDVDSNLNGLKVCRVSFSYQEGKCTYWIDLNRGSVPLQIADHYNATNLDILFSFDDLVLVPGGGWLPRRMLHVIGNGGTVYRLKVTDIDAQHRPPSTTFQLEFPEPVGLVDGARKLAYSGRKTWSLLNLPGRSSTEAKPAIPMNHLTPPDLPGEVGPGSSWAIVVIPVLLLVLVGLFVVLKMLRPRFHGE